MRIETIGDVWTFAIGAPATVDAVAESLTSLGVNGATITPAIGLWEGERESTVVVTIAGINRTCAERLAQDLLLDFKQQAVYLEHGGIAQLLTC